MIFLIIKDFKKIFVWKKILKSVRQWSWSLVIYSIKIVFEQPRCLHLLQLSKEPSQLVASIHYFKRVRIRVNPWGLRHLRRKMQEEPDNFSPSSMHTHGVSILNKRLCGISHSSGKTNKCYQLYTLFRSNCIWHTYKDVPETLTDSFFLIVNWTLVCSKGLFFFHYKGKSKFHCRFTRITFSLQDQ